METLYERLKKRRLELGLSQASVWRAVGVSNATMSDWESGKTKPNGENLSKLGKVLRVAPDWLLYGTHPRADSHQDALAEPTQVTLPLPMPSPPQARVPITDWESLLAVLTPRQQEAILSQVKAMAEQNREILAYATGSQVTEKQPEIGGGGATTEPQPERRIHNNGRPEGTHERRH